MAAEALLLLVPATLLVAFLVLVSYPAYPLRPLRAPQLAFDLAFALIVIGIAGAWGVTARYLRAGRAAGARLHPAWLAAVVAAALAGLAGAAIAVFHALDPADPGVAVGFSLLAPGALLVPLGGQLLAERLNKSLSGAPLP